MTVLFLTSETPHDLYRMRTSLRMPFDREGDGGDSGVDISDFKMAFSIVSLQKTMGIACASRPLPNVRDWREIHSIEDGILRHLPPSRSLACSIASALLSFVDAIVFHMAWQQRRAWKARQTASVGCCLLSGIPASLGCLSRLSVGKRWLDWSVSSSG